MKIIAAVILGSALTILGDTVGFYPDPPASFNDGEYRPPLTNPAALSYSPTADIPPEDLTGVVQTYCVVCHNDAMQTGNLSLQAFQVEHAPERAETAEKMIVKLRAARMPPPGMPRPKGDTLVVLVETLETLMDEAASLEASDGFTEWSTTDVVTVS